MTLKTRRAIRRRLALATCDVGPSYFDRERHVDGVLRTVMRARRTKGRR